MKIYYLKKNYCIWKLPYNISTEILSKWIINLKDDFGLTLSFNVSKRSS